MSPSSNQEQGKPNQDSLSRPIDPPLSLSLSLSLSPFIYSTTENLAVYVWSNFQYYYQQKFSSHSAQLYKVKIYETEKNMVEYYGA